MIRVVLHTGSDFSFLSFFSSLLQIADCIRHVVNVLSCVVSV